jgi:thiamine-monophosphate kinase
VKSPLTVITVSLFGIIENNGRMMTRSAARPGDIIGVTGYLGSSAAGLKMLKESLSFDKKTAAYLRKAHFRPQPRIREGQQLVKSGVKCAIDISDGLIGDLTHICEVSGIGARIRIEDLPVHPLVKKAFSGESTDLALSGGEDYELLFTAEEKLLGNIKATLKTPVTAIGEIISDRPGQVVLIDKNGKSYTQKRKGWNHFAPCNP